MNVSERGITQGLEKDSIHVAMRAKMQCCFRLYFLVVRNCILCMTVGFSPQVDVDTSFDLSSLPVPSLAWREIFSRSLTTAVSVTRFFAPGSCENVCVFCMVSSLQKAANLGSKDFQSEVIVLAAKNSVKRGFPVVGDEWALLGSGRTEKMRRLK